MKKLVLIILFLASFYSAKAATLIYKAPPHLGNLSGNVKDYAQTFKPNVSGNLDFVSLGDHFCGFGFNNARADHTLTLYETDNPNNANASNFIATSTVGGFFDININGTGYSIRFPSVFLDSNKTYTLRRNHWAEHCNGYIDAHLSTSTLGGTAWSENAGVYTQITNQQGFLEVWANVELGGLREPVIIVPGIMGSELYNASDLIWANLGRMFLDVNDQFLPENLGLDIVGNSTQPIQVGKLIDKIELPAIGITVADIFNGLLRDFESAGYVRDKDYFLLPYDWRLDLDTQTSKLDQTIDAVKRQTGSPKVNIIVHSMGGLLAEDYLQTFGKADVDKLIFIGTPHLGVPKAAKILLEGDRFSIPWLEEDAIRGLAHNAPSVYQLLPNPQYFSTLTGYIRKHYFFRPDPPLTFSETESFLLGEGLNSNLIDRADSFFSRHLYNTDFSGVDVYNIAGCKLATQAGYQLLIGNNRIGSVKYTSGDETVPLPSSDYVNLLANHKFYVKGIKHSELPSASGVPDLVLKILSGETIATSGQVSSSSDICNFRGRELLWRSPVEVNIYDDHGNHTGPSENNAIEYGIPGVAYDVIDGEKFIFLPTDESQIYRVVAKGLERGTFDLVIAENNNGDRQESLVFNDVPITTSSTVAFSISSSTDNRIISLDIGGGGVAQNISADALLDSTESDDVAAPETNVVIKGTEGVNGWFRSNVQVALSASDDNAGVLEMRYSLDDGKIFRVYNGSSIIISQEGTTAIQYFSIDRAGNDEKIKALDIKIDKTPPEFSVQFDIGTRDFIFRGVDNLAGDLSVHCLDNSCVAVDDAGNSIHINFFNMGTKEVNKDKKHEIELRSISYNDAPSNDLEKNKFEVKFDTKGSTIRTFDQDIRLSQKERISIEYHSNKDLSVISEKHGEQEFKREVEGIKVLILKTKNGRLEKGIR